MLDIEAIKREYNSILQQLSDPELISDWEKFEELSKKKNSLEKVLDKLKEIEEINNRMEENKEILKTGEDPELNSLAEAEIEQLKSKKKLLESSLEKSSNDSEPEVDEPYAVIVEVRAGTGGKEAALFAEDLFRMYSRFAEAQDWKLRVLDSHRTELGGLKEIIFELKGDYVYSQMQYEGGVHRVQRVPVTEKIGRVHTSTASVAILAKPKKTQLKINSDDLRVDFYRASGPGGQYVNKRESAVRITHIPSGLVVTSQTERNQLQNKENAMAILEARLLEQQQVLEAEKFSDKRKAQIKWAKRAEKIRTYNFPQDRVTDHRIKKSWHNIEGIMNGKLDVISKSLQEEKIGDD